MKKSEGRRKKEEVKSSASVLLPSYFDSAELVAGFVLPSFGLNTDNGSLSQSETPMPLLKALFSILLPPVAVAIHTAEFGNAFWLNLVLTLCGHIPGVIHAIYLLTTTTAGTGQRECDSAELAEVRMMSDER